MTKADVETLIADDEGVVVTQGAECVTTAPTPSCFATPCVMTAPTPSGCPVISADIM